MLKVVLRYILIIIIHNSCNDICVNNRKVMWATVTPGHKIDKTFQNRKALMLPGTPAQGALICNDSIYVFFIYMVHFEITIISAKAYLIFFFSFNTLFRLRSKIRTNKLLVVT